jgi:uracil phosphoribosyltransferase
MAIIDISTNHSLVNQYVTELRDVDIQSDRLRFRKNLERLGAIFAYEISKKLDYADIEVETPMGIAASKIIANQPVLATILRAGIPLHQGFLQFFDQADNAFVSAYRRHRKDGTFEISMDHVSCPRIDNRPLIICDPMLATGQSMNTSIEALLSFGQPSQIHIAVVIASTEALENLSRTHPEVTIWTAAIDEELTARSYIVPGLGDAGDLAYGKKSRD